jgi:hypothetical protein
LVEQPARFQLALSQLFKIHLLSFGHTHAAK